VNFLCRCSIGKKNLIPNMLLKIWMLNRKIYLDPYFQCHKCNLSFFPMLYEEL
jgi:hypothetical protein